MHQILPEGTIMFLLTSAWQCSPPPLLTQGLTRILVNRQREHKFFSNAHVFHQLPTEWEPGTGTKTSSYNTGFFFLQNYSTFLFTAVYSSA